MRIVSLLPSATDVVLALGLGDALVGVTSSCAVPSGTGSPAVVSCAVLDDSLPPAELDRAVAARAAEGASVYDLDGDALRRLQPDVILTQDLCEVCAVPSAQVRRALEAVGGSARVVSLDPHTLEDVLADVERVGAAVGVPERAAEVVEELRRRVAAVRRAVVGQAPVRVACLEWLDPPYTSGHWVPDLVATAGGVSVLAGRGERSRRTTWAEVAAAEPEVLVAVPCGYGLERALSEAPVLLHQGALAEVPAVRSGRVWAGDADRCFSRPGPGLIDGLEALAWVLHPQAGAEPPPGTVAAVTA